MKSIQIIVLGLCLFFATLGFAQVGYQKDSLQIKAYTEIEYRDGLVKDIIVKKVFCDYCTEFQLKLIGDEAYRRTYLIRNDEGVKLNNGKFNHALYIRISKKDFAEMKKDSLIDN